MMLFIAGFGEEGTERDCLTRLDLVEVNWLNMPRWEHVALDLTKILNYLFNILLGLWSSLTTRYKGYKLFFQLKVTTVDSGGSSMISFQSPIYPSFFLTNQNLGVDKLCQPEHGFTLLPCSIPCVSGFQWWHE